MATPSWSAQRSGSAGWPRQDDSSRPAPASGLVAASAGGRAGCSRAINHLQAGQQRVPKIAIAVDLSRVLELNGAEYDRLMVEEVRAGPSSPWRTGDRVQPPDCSQYQ
jgi:hypothetical protein